MELKDIILLIGGIPTITWLVSTLLFTRTSMKYIERKLFEEGIEVPWWDQRGWGFRVSTFVTLVASGKPSKHQLLADDAILKYIRSYDRILARIVVISFILFMIFAAIHYFMYASDK